MSERKYCHLATVKVGDDLRVAHVDRDASSVCAGDMVSIDTGEMGVVNAVILPRKAATIIPLLQASVTSMRLPAFGVMPGHGR